MRAQRVFTAVDSHTEGMPTRVVTSGFPKISGTTMYERMVTLRSDFDELRQLLMFEPRGHASMSGSILQEPCHPDADIGVLFIEASGCLPMCGHGAIGTATTALELGLVEVLEPETTITMDTPAGLVRAQIKVVDGRAAAVTLLNVPSYLHCAETTVQTESLGALDVAVGFGGNFYGIIPAEDVGLSIDKSNHDDLVSAGLELMQAINSQIAPRHPEHDHIAGCKHVLFTAPGSAGIDGRGCVAIHPGWVDRSPCGTGTSARMAQLHAQGKLGLNEPFVHSSLLGTTFTGELVDTTTVGEHDAVLPTITGRAWITGIGQYLLDPTDPFPSGFLLGAAHD